MVSIAQGRPQRDRARAMVGRGLLVSFCLLVMAGGTRCAENLVVWAPHFPSDSLYARRHLTVGYGHSALDYWLLVNPSYLSQNRRWYHQLKLTPVGVGSTYRFGGPDDFWSAEFTPDSDSGLHPRSFAWDEHWDGGIQTGDYELSGDIICREIDGGVQKDTSFPVPGEPGAITRVVRSDHDFRLVQYYGDQRYGDPSETLGFGRCYPMCVKALSLEDTFQGLDGKQVRWLVKTGCNETICSSDPATRVYRFDAKEWEGGLSECRVKLPSSCSYETEDTVMAICDSSQDTVRFAVIRVPDNDLDDDPVLSGAPDDLHECDPATSQPYLGDGLWGAGDSTADKDVRLEVDYCWPDLGTTQQVAEQRLAAALDSVVSIYQSTGGLHILYRLDEALGLSDVPRNMEDPTASRVLKQHRHFGGRGSAAGRGYLHVIVGGSSSSTSYCGCTYELVGKKGYHYAMYLGSTELSQDGQNDELKSVGCFAFPAAFDSRLVWGQIGSGAGMTKEDYLALCIAHEVGHALGLIHTDRDSAEWSSVMSPGFGPWRGYTQYAQFKNPSFQDIEQHWQVNTRKLLGREGCEIRGNRWVPEY
jgi:hypothetical protein